MSLVFFSVRRTRVPLSVDVLSPAENSQERLVVRVSHLLTAPVEPPISLQHLTCFFDIALFSAQKLLQLKDLRIQSLESACRHGYLAGQHGSRRSSMPALKTSNKDAATGTTAPFASVTSALSKRATGGIRARRTPMRGVAGNGKSAGARGNHAASKTPPGESSKLSSVMTPPPPPS